MKLLYRFFFFNNEAFSGVILIVAAIFAMVLANLGATQEIYHSFLDLPVELRIGALDINKNLLLLINDVLMVIFFLLVGLEVKRELVQGSLTSCQQVVFPAVAALGGMFTPSVIYLAFNYQDPVTRIGWAIPAATDIAFALGILALLGKLVPVALKMFLMTLSIIDDLGAIVISLFFYTSCLSILSLSLAVGAIAALALLNTCNVRRIDMYILVGAILWFAMLKSGIHATLAGVVVGFFIPLKEQAGISPARQLEHMLQPWVAFMILPLFAFANAGISLHGLTLSRLTSGLPLGIIFGLFIGKPLGVSLFCWLSLKLKLASMPSGMTFQQIMAIGVLCGIGFTMSIFIASLAFNDLDPRLIILAKIGILTGSLLATLFGYTLLKVKLAG